MFLLCCESFIALFASLCFTGDRAKLRHGDPSSLGAGWATRPVQTQLSDCDATPGQRGTG